MIRVARRALVFGCPLSILLALGTQLGCAPRTNLTRSHGRAYESAFAQQMANPVPQQTTPAAIQGLDSQEAAAISQSYRQSLGPKEGGEATANQPMLMVTPRATQPPPPLMPSVPQRR